MPKEKAIIKPTMRAAVSWFGSQAVVAHKLREEPSGSFLLLSLISVEPAAASCNARRAICPDAALRSVLRGG